ncbi:MAG: gliding motility-associated C-terminal domain-containing protein [Bacteroidia bacterium]|nr:gliding motility-associated C-terminal domain-containing protein [Bacteroidia bacterium]MCZ2277392.1 gliding motility-associated C-terminal domain-containing protein [Bacteroidia bacterium]
MYNHLRVILLLPAILISNYLFASHGMGGELTWKCQGTSYIFEMKFYRDCNGIPGPSSVTLTTTVPGVSSIPLSLISLTDISPTGSAGSGIQACPVCPANQGSGGGPGAVHEYVYRSAPVILPGIPPTTGWLFSWGECCRSASLTNMAGAGSLGMGIRARMYPYNGFISGQCNDNSPYFAEKPNVIICTGYQYTYNHNAVDVEQDSLVYSWDYPVSEPPIAPQAYSPGYSVNSPLPGPTQNPANIPVALNVQNGEIVFTSFTQGYFVTVIKVTAYKCGTIAAEIFREINIVLIGGCIIPVTPSVPNVPPQVSIINRKTNLPLVNNRDTLCPGDTLKLKIVAFDTDPHPLIGVQSVIFSISGSEIANPSNNPNGNCLIEPCAYTNVPLPLTALYGTQMNLDWPISCELIDTVCGNIRNTYNFVIKVKDDYCRAPGQNTNTISITVEDKCKTPPPEIRCASVQDSLGNVTLSWKPSPRNDSTGIFQKYLIYCSLNALGPFQLIDSVFSRPASTLLIPALTLVNTLGVHAQDTSIYFRMKVNSGCVEDKFSELSNIASTIKLHVAPGPGREAELTWNPVHNPVLPSTGSDYYIYRKYPYTTGPWTLIDSVANNLFAYTDSFPKSLCNDTILYRVMLPDSLPCQSWSSFEIYYVYDTLLVGILPPDDTIPICPGQSVTLTADPSGLIYQWTGPATSSSMQSITVNNQGMYHLLAMNNLSASCKAKDSVYIFECDPAVSDLTLSGTVPNPCVPVANLVIDINCINPGTCAKDSSGTFPYIYTLYDTIAQDTIGPFTWNAPLPITLNYNLTTGQAVIYVIQFQSTGGDSCGTLLFPPPVNLTTSNDLSIATLSGGATICEGQSTNIQISFVGGSPPFSYTLTTPSGPQTGTSNSNPIVIAVNPTSSFNYTLTAASGNALCGTSFQGSAQVTVNALPEATISGTTSICQNQSTNITVNFTGNATGPYTLTYNPGNVVVNNVTNPHVFSVSPATTTTYSLVSVSNANCTGTVSGSATVTVNELPTAVIVGNPTICSGDQTTIEVSFTGTAPYNYSYSDGITTYGPLVANSSPATIQVSPANTTSYTLISVSDANCAGSVSGTATVVVHQLPTAVLSGNSTICNGEHANLNLTFTGTAPFTYSYSDGISTIGPVSTNNPTISITVSPTSNTTYNLISVEDGNCSGTVSGSATVTVIPLPSAVLTGTQTICSGQTTNLTITFTGVAPFEYSYTDGVNVSGPFTTSATTVTIPVTPTSTTTYGLTNQVIGAGCTGSTSGTAIITVNAIPEALISGNSIICSGDSTSFNIAFTGSAPFMYSYSNGSSTFGPFTTSNSLVTIQVAPSLTTTYSLGSISDVNCIGTVSGSAVVTVNPLPTAVISGTTSVCDGSPATLTINFTGTPPFTYSYHDGSTLLGPFTTMNTSESFTIQPSATITYTMIAVADDHCTGTASGSATISVNEIPTATISNNSEICSGESTTFDLTFTGSAPFTYYYSNGTNTFGPFSTSNNPETVQVSPGISQTYTLISISDANCAGTVSGSATVTVHPLPLPSITGITDVCEGETSTFTATSGFVSYQWNTGQTLPSITVTATGTYTVTVTDANGCKNSISKDFTAHQVPVASFSTDSTLTCEGYIVHFVNTSTYPPASIFNWTIGNMGHSNLISPSFVFTQSGIYPVKLVITTSFGCIDSLTQNIQIEMPPLPVAEFTVNPKEASLVNGLISFTDLSQHAVSWYWDFGNGQTSTLQHPGCIYDEPGTFVVTLVVTNIAGCTASYKEDVYITPFFVPNAFTPNLDGFNETFFDVGYEMNIASYSMSIFNRWGQKVFQNDSYTKTWNGTDKSGNPVPEGIYVYAIKMKTLSGKDYYYSGRVTLVR